MKTFLILLPGVWAFISCIPSASVLHLHHLHRKGRIGNVHNEKSLNWTIAFSVVKAIVSFIGEQEQNTCDSSDM